jgi:hypothetical protein
MLLALCSELLIHWLILQSIDGYFLFPLSLSLSAFLPRLSPFF